MSVVLNPAIPTLDTQSILYAIYQQLYIAFFKSQDPKSATNPNGIVEGDQSSIRLKNTAYTFALAMCDAADAGGGGGGEGDITYLKKSGDDMSGKLSTLYGLEAGTNNSSVFNITEKTINDVVYGVLSVSGKLEIDSDDLIIDGVNVLSFNNGVLSLNGDTISISKTLIVGTASTGLVASSSIFQYKGKNIFHAGNSNLSTVDWIMKDATIAGMLSVAGDTILKGAITTEGVVSLKNAGVEVLGISNKAVNINGWLTLTNGIKINALPVISLSTTNIILGAVGGSLILGNENTQKIVLSSTLYDYNSSHTIIDKYGSATLQNGLQVKHDFGSVVLQSYRTSSTDEGIIFPKRIRLGAQDGMFISGSGAKMSLSIPVSSSLIYASSISVGDSVSVYKPLNQTTHTLFFDTETDFFAFKKPVESKDYIGISGYSTRLTNNTLFFKSNSQLISVAEGIKHYGNAYFLGSISSETFASGFAGYGMAILYNETTGNYSATFDELTIRKKMRVYELEVQKISATNGSLWVSDSCSGDTVQKL